MNLQLPFYLKGDTLYAQSYFVACSLCCIWIGGGSCTVSFSMDNPKEVAVYYLLKAYSGNHKATQFIVDLIMNSQPNDKPSVVTQESCAKIAEAALKVQVQPEKENPLSEQAQHANNEVAVLKEEKANDFLAQNQSRDIYHKDDMSARLDDAEMNMDGINTIMSFYGD